MHIKKTALADGCKFIAKMDYYKYMAKSNTFQDMYVVKPKCNNECNNKRYFPFLFFKKRYACSLQNNKYTFLLLKVSS